MLCLRHSDVLVNEGTTIISPASPAEGNCLLPVLLAQLAHSSAHLILLQAPTAMVRIREGHGRNLNIAWLASHSDTQAL